MKAMGCTASSYNLDHSGVTGGGVIPPSRSQNQRNAVATSATVIPIKYETARSFPIFIALSPCGKRHVYHSHIVKNLLFFCDTTVRTLIDQPGSLQGISSEIRK
jgi:hypothetical protein